ncbi:YitT family protein [Sulfurovum mangrovi]|uniref:YitT family protein n=1 Tax=Sulfurovum mangrovi TaxID=2893889 RepID=UPI001E47086C|nr:YitT family protein [Sulfurovum mangrovi]UFH60038.1 YitT family protein [Sulfurovum mangrovi]
MDRYTHLIQTVFVLLGALSLAFGAVGFLSPNEIITGGGIGISLLLHMLFPSLTLGTLIALVSIPFIVLGYFYFGKYYTLKTFIAIALTSLFTDLFREVLLLPALTHDTLLSAIFGGIFIGLGVGLIIKGRSSTGSTSVVGEIVAMKSRYKTGEVLLLIDAMIMGASLFVYDRIDQSLYSMVSVYITSKVVDMLLTGRSSRKLVNIVSDNTEQLTDQIRELIEEHGTIVSGIGLHKGQQKRIIFLAVDVSRIEALKRLIQKSDPEALLIIAEASEFQGRGWK